jgi:hypothetical protein
MHIVDEAGATEIEPLCSVVLTTRQRQLLEACAAWHSRVHTDPGQREEFVGLLHVLRLKQPCVENTHQIRRKL